MRVAGWNFFMSSGVAMAGPVLGAFLMATASMRAVIAVDLVGAAIAVTSLVVVRIPNPQRAESDSGSIDFVAEFIDGWRELLRHRGLFDLTLVLAAVTLFGVAVVVFVLLRVVPGDPIASSSWRTWTSTS